jgi:hypothetical protein
MECGHLCDDVSVVVVFLWGSFGGDTGVLMEAGREEGGRERGGEGRGVREGGRGREGGEERGSEGREIRREGP